MPLDAEFIDRIVRLAPPPTLELEGREYSTVAVQKPEQPAPKPLGFCTLTGLRDYLLSDKDPIVSKDVCLVHVDAPGKVSVRGPIMAPWLQRHLYAECVALLPEVIKFQPGMNLDQVTLMIALQGAFVQDQAVTDLMKFVGQVDSTQGVTETDDGLGQVVQTKKGVHLVDRAAVPRQFVLRPYRTFPEVEQPASPFFLRVNNYEPNRGNMGGFQLWEGDGGAWRLTAIQNVAAWLKEALPGWQVLA